MLDKFNQHLKRTWPLGTDDDDTVVDETEYQIHY